MNDPFAEQQASVGAARQGQDAPDLQVRIAQLKAQQGAQLTDEENRRLGVRMGLEAEAAKQDMARGLSGGDTIFGPRSTSVYEGLRGTRMDPVLAQARVLEAQQATNADLFNARVLGEQQRTDPELHRLAILGQQQRTDPRLAAAQVTQNEMAASPELRGLAEARGRLAVAGLPTNLAGTARGADIQADYDTAVQNARARGIPVSEELARQTTYKPAPVVEPSIFAPPPVPPTVETTTSRSRVQKNAEDQGIQVTVNPANIEKYYANEAHRRLATLGQTVSVGTFAGILAGTKADLAPTPFKRVVPDHLTGDTYEVETLRNAKGETFSVGQPTLLARNPITAEKDKKFTDDYMAWTTEGGRDQATLSKVALDRVVDRLSSPEFMDKWSRAVSALPAGKNLLESLSPEAAAIRESIIQEVLPSVKTLFGGRILKSEFDETIKSIYSPKLPKEENIARIGRFALGLKAATEAKEQAVKYFEDHETLGGFKGAPALTPEAAKAQFAAIAEAAKSGGPTKKEAAPAAAAQLSPAAHTFVFGGDWDSKAK